MPVLGGYLQKIHRKAPYHSLQAAEKYDIDVLFICPPIEVRRVAENTENLFVFSTYMDTLRPGRGCADILPEGLKAAGAVGVGHGENLQLRNKPRAPSPGGCRRKPTGVAHCPHCFVLLKQ